MRDLIPGEIDILIPGVLGIEVNGVYWHSSAHINDKNYHRTKTDAAEKLGLPLIHIWEDQWRDRRENVIRAIAHRLGMTAHIHRALPDANPAIAERHYARTLTCRTITSAEASCFFDTHHIDGRSPSTLHVGAYTHDNRLVACLVAGRQTPGSTKVYENTWDVRRYATCGIVVGGFSKLLRYATIVISATETIHTWSAYCHLDTSQGTMYEKTGFTIDRVQPPSYMYVGDRTGWRRKHRLSFTKSVFRTRDDLVYEPGWSERQAAEANGLYRIYDSGKIRYCLHL